MKVIKNKDHFYGRKLDDVEVNKGISEALAHLRQELPDDFEVKVTRASHETMIRVTYREDAYKPTCPHGFDDCIHDPAYSLYKYDGDIGCYCRERYTREELLQLVKEGCDCEEGCMYDDEDK